jgi:hypothetical protein
VTARMAGKGKKEDHGKDEQKGLKRIRRQWE